MYNTLSPFGNTAAGREQALKSIIDQATRELSTIQSQQYPANLTQNFQIAPAQVGLQFKIVNSLEDVNKEIVLSDSYFVDNSYNTFWIKNQRGELRTFKMEEETPKDKKDLLIEDLQNQINELKRGINNVNRKYDGTDSNQKNANAATTKQSTNVQLDSSSISKKR